MVKSTAHLCSFIFFLSIYDGDFPAQNCLLSRRTVHYYYFFFRKSILGTWRLLVSFPSSYPDKGQSHAAAPQGLNNMSFNVVCHFYAWFCLGEGAQFGNMPKVAKFETACGLFYQTDRLCPALNYSTKQNFKRVKITLSARTLL